MLTLGYRNLQLTTHFHLVARLRVPRVLPPLPLHGHLIMLRHRCTVCVYSPSPLPHTQPKLTYSLSFPHLFLFFGLPFLLNFLLFHLLLLPFFSSPFFIFSSYIILSPYLFLSVSFGLPFPFSLLPLFSKSFFTLF
jgi:hypothetical protein